jgi:hypothetical protein
MGEQLFELTCDSFQYILFDSIWQGAESRQKRPYLYRFG